MGHQITAILTNHICDAEVARRFDLRPIALTASLTMFHIDHYFTAYWQALCGTTGSLDVPRGVPGIFPHEGVVRKMMCEVTGETAPMFAIVMTDYFGGIGAQYASLYTGERRTSPDSARINDVLAG